MLRDQMMLRLIPSDVINPPSAVLVLAVFPLRFDVILKEEIVSIRGKVLYGYHIVVRS